MNKKPIVPTFQTNRPDRTQQVKGKLNDTSALLSAKQEDIEDPGVSRILPSDINSGVNTTQEVVQGLFADKKDAEIQQQQDQQAMDEQIQPSAPATQLKKEPSPLASSIGKNKVASKIISEVSSVAPNISQKQTLKYQFGEFSRYAVHKETQISQRQQIIDKVIKQAMLSHLEKVKFYSTHNDFLEKKSKQIQKKIKDLVGENQNIYKLIKEPAKQWTKIFIDRQKKTFSAKQAIEKFIHIIFYIKNMRIVDGKIIDQSNWKLSSMKAANKNNILLESKESSKVYIQLGQNKIGTSLFQWGGSLHTKQQLLRFDEKQRRIILTMVVSFLKNKKILVNEDQVNISINKMLQKALND